mgnify:FL=1
MIRKLFLIQGMLIGVLLSASCSGEQISPTSQSDMPNPASAYCEQQGYTLEIFTAADGSQQGVCVFPDGSECDEWAYFRGECKPGDSLTDPGAAPTSEADMPNPASAYCEQQGYRLQIVTAPDGSQQGLCVFPDGSTCDEWAYFRGECGPGQESGTSAGSTGIPRSIRTWQPGTRP